MIRRPPRSTPLYSSAASDVYKRQLFYWPNYRHIANSSLNYAPKFLIFNMANSKQAIKRAKQNAETYKLRHAQRSMVRTAVKAVRASIEANDPAQAKEMLNNAEKILDSSASKKVIHKNAAARTKSRLSKAVKALG